MTGGRRNCPTSDSRHQGDLHVSEVEMLSQTLIACIKVEPIFISSYFIVERYLTL